MKSVTVACGVKSNAEVEKQMRRVQRGHDGECMHYSHGNFIRNFFEYARGVEPDCGS